MSSAKSARCHREESLSVAVGKFNDINDRPFQQATENQLITGPLVIQMTSRVRRCYRLGGSLNFYERAA